MDLVPRQGYRMTDFETFRKTLVPLKRDPTITVQKRGTMSLNKAAQVLLGAPAAVELLYDASARTIGLRPVSARADHGYCLRSSTGTDAGPFVISAMAFLHFYDIYPEATLRWVAYLAGDVLCINLEDDATAVTSNRAFKSPTPSEAAVADGAEFDELKARRAGR
ncbi:MAG: hypothetical protein DLM57_08420 [Pseudonocardiales bacterium]|nr:MAG: hypothetical protein DLM57_08420 [Pseudonocardiales bacterium]